MDSWILNDIELDWTPQKKSRRWVLWRLTPLSLSVETLNLTQTFTWHLNVHLTPGRSHCCDGHPGFHCTYCGIWLSLSMKTPEIPELLHRMIPETFRTENNPLLCLTSAVVVVCFHGSGEDWCGSNCHSLYKCISQTCYPKLFWKSPKVGGVNRCSPPVGCLSVFSWFHVVSSHLTAFCSECLNRFILFQSRVQSCFTWQTKMIWDTLTTTKTSCCG